MNDPLLKRVLWVSLVLAMLATLSWGLTISWSESLATALGGGIALLNFWLLCRVGRLYFEAAEPGKSKGPFISALAIKFTALGLLLFLISGRSGVSTVPFLVGLSSVVVSSVVTPLFSPQLMKAKVEDPEASEALSALTEVEQ